MDYNSFNDEQLASFAVKNESYLVPLITRYKRRLFNYVRIFSRLSEDDIEDILQSTFIKVYYNLNDFDKNLKFSSWIYRIAHNETINFLRKNRKPGNVFCEFMETVPFEGNLAEDLDLILQKERVSQILCLLDDKYREVLVLKYLEQRDYKEISDILRKPMGTVATLVNRAKKQFKEKYQTYVGKN